MDVGRHDEADAQYDLAVAAAREAGGKVMLGELLQHQGILADERRQFTRAATLYQQALQIFQEVDDRRAMMKTYNLLGVVERNSDRLAEARAWYEKSREMAKDLKDQASIGAAAQNIGIVCLKEGEASRDNSHEPAWCR